MRLGVSEVMTPSNSGTAACPEYTIAHHGLKVIQSHQATNLMAGRPWAYGGADSLSPALCHGSCCDFGSCGSSCHNAIWISCQVDLPTSIPKSAADAAEEWLQGMF